MDGKSEAWRNAAHDLLIALAKENKYIVSDMVILFLDSAGYGLDDYSPLGGVFKRAAKAGIIKKIDQPKQSKQSLWVSLINGADKSDISQVPLLVKGQKVGFRGFGSVDGLEFTITDIDGELVSMRRSA